jgi:hypothetical protein
MRGVQFARELGRGCGPVELLVGISEGDGPAARALDPGAGRSLRAVVAAESALGPGAPDIHGQAQGAAWSRARGLGQFMAPGHLQAQQAALSLAESRGQQAAPGHLLVVLLDQGTPGVVQALSRARLDPAEVRLAALSAIGAPADEPPVAIPPLGPAGTMDRPPLPVAELDARAWTLLRWRQDHLPLRRLHRASDASALDHLERAAAWRVASRLGLGDDQRYSLLSHHADAVREAMARAPGAGGSGGTEGPGARGARGHIPARRRRPRLAGLPVLNVTAGWGVWMRNRQTAAGNAWFRLRTIRDYRNCPEP